MGWVEETAWGGKGWGRDHVGEVLQRKWVNCYSGEGKDADVGKGSTSGIGQKVSNSWKTSSGRGWAKVSLGLEALLERAKKGSNGRRQGGAIWK